MEALFVILLPYLILSLLVGMYANKKGRSTLGFFIIAALLSPLIGFVIALIVSPVDSVIEQNALKAGEMKKCTSCAELVKTEAIICKHCRTELKTI
jgi:Na+/H+-dicarboxylate symporter